MAEIKALQFTDGQSVTPPSDASNYFIKNKLDATSNPTINDDTGDGYVVGSIWVNVSTDQIFIAADVTGGAAIWKNVSTTASTLSVESKTDDYTTTTADNVIIVDAISNDVTVTLNSASGNAGQNIYIKRVDDTEEKEDTFVDGDVTTGTDNINITSHPFIDLQRVQLTTTGTLPGGLVTATDYYIIYVDSDNIKLASSRVNAISDTAVDIISATGGGTHTITSETNTVTVDGDGSETIDGDTTVLLMSQYDSIQLISDDTNWINTKELSPITGIIKDSKSSGSDGGTFTSGGWQTRDLNLTEGDFSKFGVLDSNQFKLDPGTYHTFAEAMGYSVADNRLKLRNVTDGTDVKIGLAEYAATTGAASTPTVSAYFTITSPKIFELQHQCDNTQATNGFGKNAGYGTAEIYAQVTITKIK